MKTRFKHLLFLAVLLVAFVAFTALAASATCQIGETEYASLAAAYTAASNGDTITITANETLSATLTISKSLTITSDPSSPKTLALGSNYLLIKNGTNQTVTISDCNLTSSGTYAVYLSGGAPTVTVDTVTLTSTTKASGARIFLNSSGGTLNLTDCTVSLGSSYGAGNMYWVWSNIAGAKTNVTGGTYTNSGNSRTIFGGSNTSVTTVNNATVNLVNGEAFFQEGSSCVNTRGCTITKTGSDAYRMFDLNTAGTISISGGTFTCTREIFNVRNTSLKLNVSGGTFTSSLAGTSAAPVSGIFWMNGAVTTAVVNITGGSFRTTGAYSAVYHSFLANAKFTVSDDGDAETPAPAFTSAWRVFNLAHASTLNLNAGTISITSSESCIYDAGASTINLGGATLSSTNGRGVTMNSAGTLTMTAGTISVGGFGIWANNGVATITVSGGRIENSSRAVGSSTGAAISLSNCTIACPGNQLFIEGVAPATPVTLENVTFSSSSSSNVIYVTAGGVEVEISGTSTISAGTGSAVYFDSVGSTLTISDSATLSSSDYVLNLRKAATVTIEDNASLTSTGTSNPTIYTASGASVITIKNSATVSCTNAGGYSPIYFYSAATLNVQDNAVISSASTVKPLFYGAAANTKLHISGGSFTAAYAGSGTGDHPFVSAVFDFTYAPAEFEISGGSFVSTGAYASVFQPEVSGITLTISGSPFFSSAWRLFNLYSNNTTVTISGGTFYTSSTAEHMIWQNASGVSTTVTGGNFGFKVVDDVTTVGNPNTVIGGSAGTLTISGGDFRTTGGRILYGQGANINVTGGTYTAASTATMVFCFNTAKACTVNIENITVSGVTNVFYYSGAATLNIKSGTFTSTGSTLKMWYSNACGNITLGGTEATLTMSSTGSNYVVEGFGSAANGYPAGSLTIDNNANLISYSRVLNMTASTDITINAGAYLQSGASGEGIAIWQNLGTWETQPTITMNGGTITGTTTNGGSVTGTARGIGTSGGAAVVLHGGTITVRANGTGIAVYSKVTTVTVDGGTIDASQGDGSCFYMNFAGCTLNMSGGTIIAGTGKCVSNTTACPLNISGGTMTSGDYVLDLRVATTVDISGTAILTTTGTTNPAVYTASGATTVTVRGSAKVRSTAASDGQSAIHFGSGSTLNVQDSAEISSTSGYAVYLNAAGYAFTMTGGTLTSSVHTIRTNAAGTLNLNGGTVETTGSTSDYSCVYAAGAPTIVINGGTLYSAGGRGITLCSAGSVTLTDGDINVGGFGIWANGGAGSITINGGQIRNSSRCVGTSTGATITISGGTLSAKTSGVVVRIESTTPANPITISGTASLSSTTAACFSLDKACAVTVNGGTITSANNTIYATDTLTLNLNGGTISTTSTSTGHSCVYLYSGAATAPTVHLDGATLTAPTGRGITMTAAGAITIDSGSVSGGNMGVWSNAGKGSITMNGGSVSGGRGLGTSSGSTITINGGTISGTVYNGILSEGSATGTLTINGGTISANGSNAISITNPNVTAVIKNATVTGTSGSAISCYGTLTIYGGVFTSDTDVVQIGSASNAATLTVYGGYFTCTNTSSSLTTNVRVGTSDTTVDSTATIYGGVYVTKNQKGRHTIFEVAHPTKGSMTLNSYVCYGYGAIYQQGEGSSEDVSKTIRFQNFARRASLDNISAVTGAAIRLNEDHPGIRFTSEVPAAFIERIESQMKEGTSISYGTLIVPVDSLTDSVAFTKEALTAAGITFLEIPAVNGITEEDDDSLTIRASMIDIKAKNYNKQFISILYAKYTDTENVVRYCYGDYVASNARSVADVAQMALNDVSTSKDGDYLNPYTVYDSSTGLYNRCYSRLSVRQRAILEGFGASFVPKAVDIYIIAGQSNASGYSTMTSAFSAAHTESYEHVLFSGGAGSAYPGSLEYSKTDLAPVTKGLGGSYSSNRIGAELGMAAVLSEYYKGDDYDGTEGTVNRDACIVKWADGGTHLMDAFGRGADTGSSDYREGSWTPPSYLDKYGKNNEALSGKQYYNLLEKMQNAISQLRKAGYNQINVKGVFWMQGESERSVTSVTVSGASVTVDMCSFESDYAYPALFNYLMGDLREDLGAMTGEDLSELPFVVGEISETFGRAHYDYQTAFVAMQNAMAATFDNVYTIGNTKLAVGYEDGDTAHWTSDDMLLIGKMVGTKLLNVVCGMDLDEPYLTTADADDAIVSVTSGGNTTYYNHLPYALNYAPAGATVTLLKDTTINSAINISNSNAITFNGGNHTITSNSVDTALRFIGTNLTINNLTVTHAGAKVGSGCFFEDASVTATNFAWTTTSGGITMKDSGDTTLQSNMANIEWAVYACPAGGSLTLSANLTLTKSLNLTRDITINGAGKTITMSANAIALQIYGSGTDVVLNNLNMTHNGTSTSAYLSYQNAANTLTVNGGTYQGNYWVFVANNAGSDLTLNGVTASTKNAGSVNYSVIMKSTTGTVTVSNSTIRQGSKTGAGIHINGSGTLVVGENTAFVLPSGTTNTAIRYKTGATITVPLDDATITVSTNGGTSSAQITAGDMTSHT